MSDVLNKTCLFVAKKIPPVPSFMYSMPKLLKKRHHTDVFFGKLKMR